MGNNYSAVQVLIGMMSAAILSAVLESQDIALAASLVITALYAIYCHRSGLMPLTQNTTVLLALILLVILGAYRVMFDITEVQPYIDTASVARRDPVYYGATLTHLLVIGACFGTILSKRPRGWIPGIPSQHSVIAFDYLRVVAWFPLILNLFVYFFVFRQLEYVEVHTLARGPIGFLLKTIYLTYGAIILIATGGYDQEKAYKLVKKLAVGYLIAYGVLFQVRSPILFVLLIFVYFYGRRFPIGALMLFALSAIFTFAAIGLIRDPFAMENGAAIGVFSSVLGLGEFTDTLRFALEETNSKAPMWGGGILGSFLGTSEPVANVYARMIAPEYFEEGGGFGFFLLADFVFNFGRAGAGLAIFVVGYWMAKLHGSGKGAWTYVFLPVLFGNLFALARNDFGSTFRGIVYVMLAVAVIKWSWSLIVSLSAIWSRKLEKLNVSENHNS